MHAELGYDISSSKGERYKPMVDLGGWVRSSNESNIQKNSSTFWQLKNYVTYSGNIGDKHHYTAMVGQECWESSYDFTSVFNSGLPRMKCTILPWVREPRLSMQVLEARLWHLSLHV